MGMPALVSRASIFPSIAVVDGLTERHNRLRAQGAGRIKAIAKGDPEPLAEEIRDAGPHRPRLERLGHARFELIVDDDPMSALNDSAAIAESGVKRGRRGMGALMNRPSPKPRAAAHTATDSPYSASRAHQPRPVTRSTNHTIPRATIAPLTARRPSS